MYKCQKFSLFIVILLFSLFIVSCGASRQANRLAEHKSMLAILAESNQSPEDKLDIMMLDFTKMMHESLDILNPKKGAAYVKKYGVENQEAINSIMDQVGTIPQQKSTLEMIEFSLSLLQKPYMNEFIDLLPRFQRRYNQISFVLGLTGKLKDGLLNLGMKSLGI